MIVNHPVHMKVFNRNESKAINYLSALLVCKVPAPIRNPRMNLLESFNSLTTLQRTFRFSANSALNSFQVFFVMAIKLRILNCFTRGEKSEVFKSNINADFFS